MPRTLVVRLTLWHTTIFAVLSLLLFGAAYLVLSSNLARRTDDGLGNESREIEDLYREQGIRGLREEFTREAESEGYKRIFFRFYDARGNLNAASDLGEWPRLAPPPPAAFSLSEGETLLADVSIPGRSHNARTIFRRGGDGSLFQIGVATDEDAALLEGLRQAFGVTIAAIILFGGAGGFFIAHKAMRGVQRVTDAAALIGRGDLSRRVPLSRDGREIDSLAMAFNSMLERIQSLVTEMRDVTDNIAHDLRSPIARIRGMAETTLTGEQHADEYQQMAGAVIDECDHLVHMINTALEIAQTDAGVILLSRDPVDVGRLAADACDLFLPAAEDKGLRLELHAGEPPLYTFGDATRLQRVVSNLLDNAVKFTASGGRITVSTAGTPSHVILTVSDTGAGIAGRDLPRIFDRFYRGDRSRSAPGNGLGLSLALSIIRAHGGRIFVESAPGIGSTFTVRLSRVSPFPAPDDQMVIRP